MLDTVVGLVDGAYTVLAIASTLPAFVPGCIALLL